MYRDQSGEAAAGAADAMEIPEGEGIAAADEEEPAGTEEMTELSPEEELPEIALPDDIAEEVAATEAEEVSDAAEEVLPKIQLEPEAETEDAKPEEKLPEIAEPDSDEDNIGERKPITHLSKEQKAIFTYFVPVSGMEPADLSGQGKVQLTFRKGNQRMAHPDSGSKRKR